jgi:D-amino-acid dehydrogenase
MQVAVIGGGVVGVCSAYFLAAAGHQVAVLERYGSVAEETSFANAGLVSPGLAGPIAAPGAPRRLIGWLSRPQAPVFIRPDVRPALWRWLRRWVEECQLDRFRLNKERMQRLAGYSQSILGQLREHHALDYQQTRGILQLIRSPQELQMAGPLLDMLAQCGHPHRQVDPDAVRLIEPALSDSTPLAAAIHFPDDESGNCALFTRQLRSICQDLGVEFHFNSLVDNIAPANNAVSFNVEGRTFAADAVVIAAGVHSAALLRGNGPALPIYPVHGFSATANIKNFDCAPLAAVFDDSYQLAITRMGNRVRVAGTFELGGDDLRLSPPALRTLVKCGNDWFGDAANYNSASFWCGASAMLPEGVPLLGATATRNVFVNIAHGTHGWAMAPGAGKIIADLVSGRASDIDLDGLTLARYG